MTARAPIKARRPRLRWYLQVARLHLARLLLLPPRERLSRAFALLAAALLISASVTFVVMDNSRPLEVDGLGVSLAWVNFVWQLVAMIVSALISYALRPKPKEPEVAKANIPVAEDGKGIERIYGEVWIDDPYVLGFKQLGQTPIKAKGGKK